MDMVGLRGQQWAAARSSTPSFSASRRASNECIFAARALFLTIFDALKSEFQGAFNACSWVSFDASMAPSERSEGASSQPAE